MIRRRGWQGAGACALLALAMVEGPSTAGAASVAPAAAAPSVRVRLIRAKESTAQRLVLVVRVEGADMVLGAYEGRVQFDPAVLVVDSVVAGRDGSRYVNPADAGTGLIRFAGFTPTGFSGTEAVRIVARALRPIEHAKMTATLGVAGDLEGRTVPKAGLIGASSVETAP